MKNILILFVLISITSCKNKNVEKYDTGEIKKITALNNKGEFDGLVQSFYQNGNLQEEIIYINGLKHGQYKCFFINGKIKTEGLFSNDSVIYNREYDSTGILIDGYIDVNKFNFDTVIKSTIKISNFKGFVEADSIYNATITNNQIPSRYLRLFLFPGNLYYTDSTFTKFSFKVTPSNKDSLKFNVLIPLNKKQGLQIHSIYFKIRK